MKTSTAVLLLLCVAVVPSASASLQAPPGKAAAVHDELRAFRDGLLDAVNKGDLERELAYFHPNVVVTWHNAEVSRSRDGVRAYLNRMLKSPGRVVAAYHADVNVDELTILYGDEVGISFGSALEHFEMVGGKRLDLPARWSATLVKAGGKWLIASLHASDNLFDNPLLAIAKRMAWWAGGLGVMAGVAGLAGGFALGRRRRRA